MISNSSVLAAGFLILASAFPCGAGESADGTASPAIVDVSDVVDHAASSDETILRSRVVRLPVEGLVPIGQTPDSRVHLQLFPDAAITVMLDRASALKPGQKVWSGRLAGKAHSSFTVVIRNGVWAANFRALGEPTYQVRYLGGGVHVIREIDESRFPPCGMDHTDDVAPPPIPPPLPPAGTCTDDGSVIDLLVVYTAAARAGQGGTAGIEALIALAEAETNQAYLNSEITTTSVAVVAAVEIDYEETGNSGTDRDRLVDPNDGFLDEVHLIRDSVSADVVSLIVDSLASCGRAKFSIAAGNVPIPEFAFNVVKASCATGNFTFGHELGHNQGSRHDRGGDNSDGGAFLYSHGYIEPGGLFRSVMGIQTEGVPRLQYFSNPNVLIDGVPIGVPTEAPNSAYNALSLANTAVNVANFRRAGDCNLNGLCDVEEIAAGTAADCNNNLIPDDCEIDCNSNGVVDDCDIADGTSVDCSGNGIPDECEADCNANGVADMCDIIAATSEDANGNGVPDECEPPILFVDAAAVGLANGTNWADAFGDLQSALAIASGSDGLVEEIWVKAGTYRPAGPNESRSATFSLVPGTDLYGGFAGGETLRAQRNPEANITILSGDLNGDDEPGFLNTSENTYNVVTASGTDAGTVIDGFTITAGRASGSFPHSFGGGMHCANAVTLSHCRFSANQASFGGALFVDAIDPVITHCRFQGNKAFGNGGALYLWHVNAALHNCAIHDNVASGNGGAVRLLQAAPRFDHCTITGNSSVAGLGGALYLGLQCDVVVANSLVWGNTAQVGSQIAVAEDSSSVQVLYSDVQGGAAAVSNAGGQVLFGVGNLDADPLLNADGVHLLAGSPCVNAGDPFHIPLAPSTDIDGDARILACRADIGADETPFFADCNANGASDICDITDGMSEDTNVNGVPDECEPTTRVHVATSNCLLTGPGTETDPFCTIQAALDAAPSGTAGIVEVVLADGVYAGIGNKNLNFGGKALTLRSLNGPQACIIDVEFNGRAIRFNGGEGRGSVVEGITLTHGSTYNGGGILCEQASPTIRDCVFAANDNTLIFTTSLGAALYCEDSSPAIINCTFTGNRAVRGGAVYSLSSDPYLENCTFVGNQCEGGVIPKGGAVYIEQGTATLVGCTIQGSTVADDQGRGRGGGIYCLDADLTLHDCTVSGNTVGTPGESIRFGGGLYQAGGDLDIQRSTFSGNSAGQGGALHLDNLSASLSDCNLRQNDAAVDGGGLHVHHGATAIVNCVIDANTAGNDGGAVFSRYANPTFIQCTMSGNQAGSGEGGALFQFYSSQVSLASHPALYGCTISNNIGGGIHGSIATSGASTMTVANSILWGNTGGGTTEENQIKVCENCDVQTFVDYSCIQGWTSALGGSGNISADPLLVDADGADNLPGTADDNLRLLPGSPVIDAAQNSAGPSAGGDLDGDPRRIDDPTVPDTGLGDAPIIDMGAYEFGDDCNGNGIVDSYDTGPGGGADCNGNTIPDECETDCESNGVPDDCDIASGTLPDCDGNAIPDSCDIAGGASPDTNGNGIPDICDPGACCGHDGVCTISLSGQCAGATWALDGLCGPNTCPQPGRCCPGDGSCAVSLEAQCAGGSWAEAAACEPNVCPAPPSVGVLGARYLAITTTGGLPAEEVAIRVDADESCISRFVDLPNAEGLSRLVADPVYATPAQWGQPIVSDEGIIPGTAYSVRVVHPAGTSHPTAATTWLFGDANNDSAANFGDIQLTVAGFLGDFGIANREAVDFSPCVTNGIINFDDIQKAVLAFQGIGYQESGCTLPCP